MRYEDNQGRSVSIVVEGLPISKGSVKPFTVGRGKSLPADPRERNWEQRIAIIAAQEMRLRGFKPYEVPISITGVFRMPRPKQSRFDYPATQARKTLGGGDLDKLCRSFGDALQTGLVVRNDAQIVHWDVRKLYADTLHKPGAYMRITPYGTEQES